MSWAGGGGGGEGGDSLWEAEAENTEMLRELALESAREQAAELAEEQARCLARDRKRLDAREREMRRVVASVAEGVDAETLDEYRQAIKLSCAADGQSVMRKRLFNAVAPAASATTAASMRLFAAHEWIWDEREAARAITDEDLTIRQHMLSLVNTTTSLVAPPRGSNRTCALVTSIEDMRLQSWMLAHTPALFTTNIVATADFGTTINALTLVNRIVGASFNPRCFAAVKLRMHGSTHLIFSGGLVVCTGSKSTENTRLGCIDTALLLMRVGIHAQFLNFQVRNVASTATTGFDVDLFAIAHTYPLNAHYMPDSFPGLTFRLHPARLALIVFKSGCCILTGVRTRCEAIVAWTWFYCNILWHFQVRSGNGSVSDTEYGRRARQDESMVEQVCESICDVTQSLFASAIAARTAGSTEPLADTPADEYFAALREATHKLDAHAGDAKPEPLDLELWLRENAARASGSPAL